MESCGSWSDRSGADIELALLWQILRDTGFPNQFFCDSWVVGFWRADHGWQDIGLERRAWTLAQAVSGSAGSQGAATDVPALRVGTDRSWRSQEHSTDGEAACAGRMRPIAPLHCRRGLGCSASGNRTAYPSR